MLLLKARLALELPPINKALSRAAEGLPHPVRPIARHIFEAGGKRLRPLLTILMARLLGYDKKDIYDLAVTMEMLHAATLLHDDVLDNADTRRGKPAAHTIFNATSTILAGDAMLAHANALVAQCGDPRLCLCFSEATSRTARDTAAMVLGIARDSLRVYTSVQYRITCTPDRMLGREEVEALARDLLCNTLIQRFRVKSAEEWQAQPGFEAQAAKVTGEANDTVDVVPLSSMDDEALQKASRDNTWALTLRELHCIRDQFATPDEQARRKAAGLPADPTDVEMEVLAQTWSEHCKHKIFASRIHYENKETGQREEVNNLYKTCIRDATAAIRKRLGDDDYCKSVFKDNAGVIAFINGYDACIKVETHNSPSALDPYGGALTGIVGVNRDPMGTGMGAELVCNTDVLLSLIHISEPTRPY